MPFESKSQQKWMFANKPEMAKRWANHTKDIKSLPEHKEKKVEMSKEAAFKAGFLLRCIEEGLTTEQIAERTKIATEKSAEGSIWSALGGLASNIGGITGSAGLALPLAAGGLTGYTLGKVKNRMDIEDADSMNLENRVSMYRRMAEEAQRAARLKKLQSRHPGELVQIS